MVLINDCATSTATAYKRLKDLELNIPHDNAIVHGQHDKLQLAFENIIENAFKFSDPGNKVTVSIYAKKMPTIEIDIEDHGVGLSSKDQKKLFKVFTNIESANTGTPGSIKTYSMGLGLYISKIIIEQHGGKLELQSAEGKGTKVIVRLKRDMWRYYYGQK
jgi:signal transduction histidine kinase